MTEDKIFLIGNYIVELRENKKLKKYEFAEILGISPSAVSQWEKGKTAPDESSIVNICNNFNVNSTNSF
jgi:transcriptional regulator with XRE-family HTH domain